MEVDIRKVSNETEMQQCLAIRLQVFVEGQKVPLDEEIDGKDTEAQHYLLSAENLPCATARVRFVKNQAKIERVAVLESEQGKGYGYRIMQAILDDLEDNASITEAKLSSQTHAIAFYERLGFRLCSEIYLDAGIEHRDMVLSFRR